MSRDSGAEGEYLDPRSLLASLSRTELERIIRERLGGACFATERSRTAAEGVVRKQGPELPRQLRQ